MSGQPRHPVTRDDLASYCRAHLAAHKAPRHWVFVDAFPLTPSGKVQKFVLRREHVLIVAGDALVTGRGMTGSARHPLRHLRAAAGACSGRTRRAAVRRPLRFHGAVAVKPWARQRPAKALACSAVQPWLARPVAHGRRVEADRHPPPRRS